jgi:iron complex transport system ATP-binding protein
MTPDEAPLEAERSSAEAGLHVRDVVAGYPGRDVLHGVTVKVRPGEVVGLIGPNGSGKSTLVRVASRGLRPARGSVAVHGVDPYAVPARSAARLAAVVPQELAPAFSFSVLEVVMMGRSPYLSAWRSGGAEDWAAARQAMATANVQHLADRPLDELSGGERQRAVIAQALAQSAPVLLLDEPTTHLDLRHVLDAMRVMRELAAVRGAAVLAVFHDLSLAGAFCDRIYAMADGRIVAGGAPAEVVTPALLREVYGVEADVTIAPATGRPSVALAPPSSAPGQRLRRVHVIGGAGRGAEAIRALVERGFEVTVGVLHAGDSDEAVAARLDLERVSVPAFAVVDPRSEDDCLALARGASAVLLCDPPFGPGNLANLRVASAAAVEGVPVHVLEETPIGERDFTGGEATRLWGELASRAVRSESIKAAIEAVSRTAAGPPAAIDGQS